MATDIRAEAKRLIDALPEGSTWDDVMHQVYVRQAIESGLADSREGRLVSVEEVRRKYGLPE